MICCKCGRTIDRTYGRITDLGNYCKACAYQNEEEANQIVKSAIEKAKAQAVKEFAEKLKNGLSNCCGYCIPDCFESPTDCFESQVDDFAYSKKDLLRLIDKILIQYEGEVWTNIWWHI